MGVDFAVIGGTGAYDPEIMSHRRSQKVDTPFGAVSLNIGRLAGKEIAFLARHGEQHSVPPHLVNYRANIWALKKIGVIKILASAAVGSLTREFVPGSFVLVDQFLDFTKNRPSTFFNGEQGVLHIDMSDPYCGKLRESIVNKAEAMDFKLNNGGTYVCTEGPRFETPAEIAMFRQLGAHVVGMTSVPEVVLARECGMCYTAVAMVTNYAAGISPNPLTHLEVMENMNRMSDGLRQLVSGVLEDITTERSCACGQAADEVGKF